VLAIVFAIGTAGLITHTPVQLSPILVESIGLLMLALGAATRGRGYRLVGAGIMFAGSFGILSAVGVSVAFPGSIYERALLCLGTLGVATLSFGVLPIQARWSRQLLTLGTIFLFGGVVLSGVVYEGSLRLVGAVVTMLLGWDAGEQAISLDEQVGRQADTRGVELVHSAGSAATGVVAIVVAAATYRFGVAEIPPLGLGFLLAAVLVLAVAIALYQ
jgi:hypothetical protein